MKAIENNELQKKMIFIDEEDSDSKEEEEKKGLTCLECAKMKATDDTLINGKVIQLQVLDSQRQLDETRRAEKWQKCHNALLKVKRDKEIRPARAILNSNNNIMNNSNNTNSTSHNNSTTSFSSNVNNSNNSTNTTTTSTNDCGDSNCNNTHNININIHNAGLNLHQGLSLQEFNDLLASQRYMRMNNLYCQSFGMYQGHQSLGMYHGHADPFLYNVNLPMLSTTKDVFFCQSECPKYLS